MLRTGLYAVDGNQEAVFVNQIALDQRLNNTVASYHDDIPPVLLFLDLFHPIALYEDRVAPGVHPIQRLGHDELLNAIHLGREIVRSGRP